MEAAETKNATLPVILVGHDVLEKIAADAAHYESRSERGGVFIGLRRGPHIEVREATVPMRWDFGSMFSFKRSSKGHQRVALRRWRESSHTMDWVGEWHSHPEPFPTPSGIDLRSWKGMTTTRGAPMVFVIVGYNSLWVGLAVPGLAKPIRYIELERSVAGVAFTPQDGVLKSHQ